jgi:hypothetical protein
MSGWRTLAVVIGATVFVVMGAVVAMYLYVSWPAS